ncbi:MAG TPA: hypothetical protein VF815_06430 [Myxococcaceae bacterium]|jgi:hypothetical protein
MPDFNPVSAEDDKTPRSYVTEPPRHVEYASIPPDVTLKPEGIYFKDNVFVVSVAAMAVTSLVTFFLPFFNGLLGGLFGGYHAGRMKRALGAALVSSLVGLGTLMFFYSFSYSFESPEPLYLFWGLGLVGYVALYVLGTFIGAVAGALSRPIITERNMHRYARVAASSGPRTDVSLRETRGEL